MIDFHRAILADTLRNDAFRRALKKAVKPGAIVADVGAGTGFLAFLASKFGAKECHLYEYTGMLELSQRIAKQSGITNCRFHKIHSGAEKRTGFADVLVSEVLGNYALEENIIETLRHARRFLKPNGVMIPQSLTQFVTPVIVDRFHRELDIWNLEEGIDFGPARESCLNNLYVRRMTSQDLAPNSAKEWDVLEFSEDNSSIRERDLEWAWMGQSTVYGFCLWWSCALLPGIELSTDPASPPTHWEQIYLPLLQPLELSTDDQLRLTLRSDTRPEVKVRVQWTVEVKGKDGKKRGRQEMDMWKGHVD